MKAPRSRRSRRRRFDYRGLVTLLVTLSFFVMLISGVVVFLAPSGQIAKQIDWTMIGLDRAKWLTLHISFAVVFIVFSLVHLTFNWRALLHHLRDRVSKHLTLKWEAALAIVVTVWLIAGALVPLPPANNLHDLSEHFRKTFWADAQRGRGKTVAPVTVEVPGGDAEEADAVLPDRHFPVSADKACSDCHR
ncbi:MAG: DUF4405 domain-containing protein [Alphaproteobacteria bacterium]